MNELANKDDITKKKRGLAMAEFYKKSSLHKQKLSERDGSGESLVVSSFDDSLKYQRESQSLISRLVSWFVDFFYLLFIWSIGFGVMLIFLILPLALVSILLSLFFDDLTVNILLLIVILLFWLLKTKSGDMYINFVFKFIPNVYWKV